MLVVLMRVSMARVKNLTINSWDVKNIHLQCDNDLVENDELHIATIAI
jgi:hypothetical protein